jgi:DNA-binding transcriptional MerR regulator
MNLKTAPTARAISIVEVCQAIGIPERTLRRWIAKGYVIPCQYGGVGGRLKNGDYRRILFTFRNVIEIKSVLSLRRQGFSMSKILNVLQYIRHHNYHLDASVYQTDGRTIWVRDLDVGDGVIDPEAPAQAVFLPWSCIIRSTEQEFGLRGGSVKGS